MVSKWERQCGSLNQEASSSAYRREHGCVSDTQTVLHPAHC